MARRPVSRTDLDLIPKTGPIRYTPAEVRAQKQAVAELLVAGLTLRQIHDRAHDSRNAPTILSTIGRKRLAKLVNAVRLEWADEDKEASRANRAEAERRIKRNMRVAMGTRGPDGKWSEKPNLMAYARLEELLADLQGTRSPIEVDVNVHMSVAITSVIAELSSEDVAEILALEREKERALEEYRRGKVLPPAVVVDAPAAEPVTSTKH